MIEIATASGHAPDAVWGLPAHTGLAVSIRPRETSICSATPRTRAVSATAIAQARSRGSEIGVPGSGIGEGEPLRDTDRVATAQYSLVNGRAGFRPLSKKGETPPPLARKRPAFPRPRLPRRTTTDLR
ncbi:hypothetical protein RHA1_ro06999 [Rhodococcus jostii RHA1]|uniref:Uncharacterized protein n=1 Tax=Rhodococcus jostii (strain RHA1) TaxID=101510 RepID=Q0S121_RHOJR|nr:hypothetical protein RHA1_ro06999 [Rhodococcus jostii RHA1]